MVNLAFYETMSFEIQRMSSETSFRVVRSFEIQVAKATNGQKNGFAEESKKKVKFSLIYLNIDLYHVQSQPLFHTEESNKSFFLMLKIESKIMICMLLSMKAFKCKTYHYNYFQGVSTQLHFATAPYFYDCIRNAVDILKAQN